MRKPLISTLAMLALFLSACGASSEPAETDVQPVAETEEAGPSVEQFASIIAESRGAVDDWLDEWDEYTCSSLTVADGDPLCEASLTGGGYVALTASLKLEAATKTDAPAYIGDPPDEISIIWQSTEDAATAAATAGEDIPEGCSTSDECAGKVMEFTSAMTELQAKYGSWAPYM